MPSIEIADKPACIPNEGGQADFVSDWENLHVALEGGWGSGKTWAGSRKLLSNHLYNAFDVEGNPTYVSSVFGAPTYSNAFDFGVPALQDGLDQMSVSWTFRGSGSLPGGKYAGPAIIIDDFGTKKNPSVILIRTGDAPDRITGFEVGGAWIDEAARWRIDLNDPLKNGIFQMWGRVRHLKARRRQILYTYTNEGDNTFIYHEMHSGKDGYVLYRAASYENEAGKTLFDQYKESLTPELIEQYLMGGAANFRGGKVYGQYKSDVHIDNSLELRPDMPLQLALDFNIAPGMHAEIGQWFPLTETFTCVYEIHDKSLDVRGVVSRLGKLIDELGGWQWSILEVYGDASGQNRWAGTGENCYDVLCQALDLLNIPYRLKVPTANSFIADRVNAFNCALLDFSGKIRWRCHSRCRRLIDDLETMSWSDHGEIEQRDRKLGHASDAEGYRINYLRPVRIIRRQTGGKIGFTHG
jgi:hypothetical protein